MPDLRVHLPILEGRGKHWRKKLRLNNDSLCQPSFKSLVFIIEVSLAQSKNSNKRKDCIMTMMSWNCFSMGDEGIAVITFLSVLLQ